MPLDPSPAGAADARWLRLSRVFACVAQLYGCAGPAETAAEPPVDPPAASAPSAAAAMPAPAPPPEPAAAPSQPLELVLVYADRVRGVPPAELVPEIARLGEAGDSATRLMQLAVALTQSKVAANTLRAQALLQRVLGHSDQEARALHPLARLMAAQLAESRRAEEQLERQAQQLRDAQRRIDQLNERLEAVRAIERSLPPPPPPPAPPTPPAARP